MDKFNSLYVDCLYKNKPTTPEVYELGIDLVLQSNDFRVQEDLIYKLLNMYPNDYKLYYLMGTIHRNQSTDKSLFWFKKCYAINAHFIENVLDLTKTLFENDNYEEVNRICKKLVNPTDRRILLLMGTSYIKSGHYNDAVKVLEKTITGQNDSTDCYALQNMGILKNDLNLYEDAIKYLKKAYSIATDPNNKQKILGNILITSDYIYFDSLEKHKLITQFNEKYTNTKYFGEHNRRLLSHLNIGYVSSDFSIHAVANFILPILENHDKQRFQIFLYSTKQYVSPQFFQLGFPIKNIYNVSSVEAAKIIYEDKIDILFDLNGHTDGSRLDVFALNPAPVQITYMGYPNTTGLKSMHYRLTDNISDHPESKQIYSEKLVYLPSFFLVFKSIIQNTPIIPRKTDKTVYLGSLNKENKSSPDVLRVWKEIMKINKNTKIIIKTNGLIDQTEFYKNSLDIQADRLILLDKSLSNEQYIALFSKIDILLDTFPYSGTTTTCNALYNSIPVITLYNKDYHSHNVSSSILMRCGFPELVARTFQEYIDKTTDLIKNTTQIDIYKTTIGESFNKYMNASQFMRSYEETLENLYNERLPP
jgi:predicted O-linked N-acetylglucosamine transferase (SPINDLY family)